MGAGSVGGRARVFAAVRGPNQTAPPQPPAEGGPPRPTGCLSGPAAKGDAVSMLGNHACSPVTDSWEGLFAPVGVDGPENAGPRFEGPHRAGSVGIEKPPAAVMGRGFGRSDVGGCAAVGRNFSWREFGPGARGSDEIREFCRRWRWGERGRTVAT